jgi:hypothetical protein
MLPLYNDTTDMAFRQDFNGILDEKAVFFRAFPPWVRRDKE